MKRKIEKKTIVRDLSWLAFNARVLQEAKDKSVPLAERLRFLGIFSNNLDEFFRVRVATLNRMVRLGKAAKVHLETSPTKILNQIQDIVLDQQRDFDIIYRDIQVELKRHKVALVNETQLTAEQKKFVVEFFNEKVRTHITPLMIESIPELPLLQDKSIYLACLLGNTENSFMNSYALIEVPAHVLPRFIILPPSKGIKNVILLEDIIRYCLPQLFTQFGFNFFEGYIIKVTRDAELDIDDEDGNDVIKRIEKGLLNRKKGKAVRLVYDKSIQKNLLGYLVKLLHLSKKDHLIPGGRIHNFKDFMEFPFEIFAKKVNRQKPFTHPLLTQPIRILEVLDKRDVMLHFPYHSFDSIIDLLREAAIDPYVEEIKITCYRLAKESKIINALVNAFRNGKKVTVVLELRARFDEEANLKWKRVLEEEGLKVLVGKPDQKIHAKLCLISKRIGKTLKSYGFVSTGNLNESTARFYGDHCLLTSDKNILNEVKKVFLHIEYPTEKHPLPNSKYLIASPSGTRPFFLERIKTELKHAKAGERSEMILKLNSLSDELLINEIYASAKDGVHVQMIIRGICCALTTNPKWTGSIEAISIVDEYLEHARLLYFYNKGKQDFYISSADWMVRNLDHRIEVSVPIVDTTIKEELYDILQLQLSENVKARLLDNDQENRYKKRSKDELEVRSQVEIYKYLASRKY
jgi:polyphosphate kinase